MVCFLQYKFQKFSDQTKLFKLWLLAERTPATSLHIQLGKHFHWQALRRKSGESLIVKMGQIFLQVSLCPTLPKSFLFLYPYLRSFSPLMFREGGSEVEREKRQCEKAHPLTASCTCPNWGKRSNQQSRYLSLTGNWANHHLMFRLML